MKVAGQGIGGDDDAASGLDLDGAVAAGGAPRPARRNPGPDRACPDPLQDAAERRLQQLQLSVVVR